MRRLYLIKPMQRILVIEDEDEISRYNDLSRNRLVLAADFQFWNIQIMTKISLYLTIKKISALKLNLV
jgi:type IV secretory pathway ATPase VirB11/archaellum biosynthesis ATPase